MGELVDCYAVEIPIKSSNVVLNLVKRSIRDFDSIPLLHLRRLAKPAYLPAHLRVQLPSSDNSPSPTDASTSTGSDTSPSISRSTSPASPTGSPPPTATPRPQTIVLLVCPIHLVSSERLTAILSTAAPFLPSPTLQVSPYPLKLLTLPAPLHPPTTGQAASSWTATHWPTVYKRNNPFGAHPAIVSRAESEIKDVAGKWLQLAQSVGQVCKEQGWGIGAGCVIVERSGGNNGKERSQTPTKKWERVVAVAGDARWYGRPDGTNTAATSQVESNPLAHAVMRAIAMVANKRLALGSDPSKKEQLLSSEPDYPFLSKPLTPLEARYASTTDNLSHNGYLCLDLELYVSHEPCVGCAMAALHSRFGRLVFGRRMQRTGALVAEVQAGKAFVDGGLGYGLFWRPELNWKGLVWQFQREVDTDGSEVCEENGADEPFSEETSV
ncbi:cytidine deaminase-like protein [Lineolata rhizophorae]|uniref:Cytidine deaminase-like protein n=1 Tax=Lineolata rhizophorae TaxID=578093 RepID=A0A6A6NSR6_9PEZI|nr:cytidine deaminase-like protein [Lineolata rhizophorae]